MSKGNLRNFLIRILCIVMILQGMPLWQLSSAYSWGLSREKIQNVLDILSILGPSAAEAAPPKVICVPQLPTDLLVPHETWSGEPTILKGVAKEVSSGTYYWEFGDGESSTPTAISDADNLAVTHTYTAPSGTLFIARLHVINDSGEEASDEYRVLVKEKTLDVEVNKAIDDGLWWLYTNKELINYYSIIPASAFSLPDGSGNGLLGQYFNNTALSGDPALERTDPNIDFTWSGSPGTGVNNDFSVRWTGILNVPADGNYYFASNNDDGTRLYIDGNIIIDDWMRHGPTWRYSAPVHLTAGPHTFRVDFYDGCCGAQAKIYWSNYKSARWNNSRYGSHYGNTTGSAVQAFEINGHLETGDPDEDPYVDVVRAGLTYIFSTLSSYNIGAQHGDDPDSNGNGIGLNWPSNRPIYELGAIMDALVATGTPDAIAQRGGANVVGRRYQDIVQDMVDMYAWGQGDWTNGGGWRYGWNDWPDNSASQWGAIGLIAAERHFGCTVPEWVKTYNNGWLNHSYNGTGFGYTGRGNGWATTPSGMVQLSLDGMTTTDNRWETAENWLANNWSAFTANNRNDRYYSYYAFAKAMRLALPNEVTHLSATGLDWYGDETQGLARILVDRQNVDGSWPYDGWPYVGERTAAAWNIIILTRTLFEKPPVAIIHAEPNPGAVGQTIRFDASASYHVDPAKEIVQCLWDFDASDGVDFEHPDATGVTASHAYGNLQDYTVSLKVIDNSTPERFDTTSLTIHITVPPHPPTAVIGGPYIAAVGEEVHVDGSGSYDIDQSEGDSITAWDWESDMVAPYEFNEAHGETAVLPAFAAAGRHDIILRVTDNTAAVFPSAGQPDLSDTDYGEVVVYSVGVTDLYARAKATKCQLVWSDIGGAPYEILRSAAGPNRGFEQIGTTDSTYSTFIDYNVELYKDYWYRVRCQINGETVLSAPVHINSRGRIRNRPPVITSTPVTTAQEAVLYEYQVQGSDPEGSALTFILDQAPEGMSINRTTGLISWTPEYSQIGVNDVTVRVQDARRASATQFFQVVVEPRPNSAPLVDIGGPYSGLINQEITFTGSATDPEGDAIRRYHWSFGDGAEANGTVVTHTYMASGSFTVTLFVTDDRGATGSAETRCQIEFPNRAPIANIGGPSSGVINTDLTFDGSNSYDADSDELTYTWNFGDSTPSVTGSEVTHAYSAPGIYKVGLTVDDGRGGLDTSEITVVITPPNQNPSAAFTVSGTIARGHTITFDGTRSSDPEGRPLAAWEWDFGDGSRTTGEIVTHVFSTPGDYTVTLTVTDAAGATGVAVQNLHVIVLSVEVPDLSGMTEEEARAALEAAGLHAAAVAFDHSATVPAGQVMNQTPPAGSTVEEDSLVHFVISTGPLMVTVPDVTGMAEANATETIENALLNIGSITTATSATVEAGNVISQNPPAGAVVQEGESVDIQVSAGPAPVSVPEIINMTQAEAETALAAVGLVLGNVSESHSLTVPQGNVLSQKPEAGQLAPPGSSVDITISSGPLMVIVPDITGMEQADAESAILNAQLIIGNITTVLSQTVPEGRVVSQDPAAGEVLQEQSAVNLVISAGPEAVEVPTLVGMTQADAENTIHNSRLTVGNISMARDNDVPQGSIISQDPQPGVMLPPGSPVDIVVCEGPHIPTTIELNLESNLISAGESAVISVKVFDDAGALITPAPQLVYDITFNPLEVNGTEPTEGGGVISTAEDTRGPYTLVVSLSDDSTVTASEPFVVVGSGPDMEMAGLYSRLSESINIVTRNTEVISEALDDGDVLVLQNAIDALRAARDNVDLENLARSAAFAPEQGFPPTLEELQSRGYTAGPDDAAFKETIQDVISLLEEATWYLNNMDASSTVDDEAVLEYINNSLNVLAGRLRTLHPTIYGGTDARLAINYLMASVIPQHLYAVVNRLEVELQGAGLVTQDLDADQFYKALQGSYEQCSYGPERMYGDIEPAFFSLAGMSVACQIQMKIINQIYVPVMWDIGRMMAIMAIDGVLQHFNNFARMEGIITGASLSFHAFHMAGSVIELDGPFNWEYPSRNEVYLVGPDTIQALIDLIDKLRNLREAENLYDLYNRFTEIADLVRDAYDASYQPTGNSYSGCILSWSNTCNELVFNNGFDSVYHCQSWLCPPSPVLILVKSPDSGQWAFGTFNFVASN